MRFYEMVLIADSELTDEGYRELLEKIEKLLRKKRKKVEKGELLHVDDWGVRRMAYPIEKKPKGRYIVLTFKSLTDTLSDLERNLTLMGEVLRFQTVKLKSEPVFKEKPAEESGSSEEKASEEVAPVVEEAAEEPPA